MNEQLRQAYLQTMGIDVFYPRVPVPGARPSPEYDLSVPAFLLRDKAVTGTRAESGERQSPAPATEGPGSAKTGASGPQQRSAANVAAPSASRTQAARAALGLQDQSGSTRPAATAAGPLAGAKQTTIAEAPAGSAGGEVTPRFRLEYKRISAQLAILQEVPLHAQQQLSEQTAQLLGNILRALEVFPDDAGQGNAMASELFNWPLLDDLPAEEATPQRASQALLGFIAMRKQRDDFRNLLVFTSQSGQVVELLPEATTASGSDYRLEKFDCWLTRVSTLQEMLSVPSIKREVWQDLQSLRMRLKSA